MNAFARMRTPQFWSVLFLFAISMGIAHWVAETRGAQDAKLKAVPLGATETQPAGQDAAGAASQPAQGGQVPAPRHTAVYYHIIFTVWIATVLVTVALCLYPLRSGTAPSNSWVSFWTFAYLAYLVHFAWAAGALFHWNFAEILHSHLGENANPEKVVDNPIPDLILTCWWGIDVILTWCVLSNPAWLRIERGVASAFVMVAFVGATVLAAKAGMVAHVLGILLLVSVATAHMVRFVLRPAGPQPRAPGLIAALLHVFHTPSGSSGR